jgi:hypothetical protein
LISWQNGESTEVSMLRDLTFFQLAENFCTAIALVAALVLALYFVLDVARDIRRAWKGRRKNCPE